MTNLLLRFTVLAQGATAFSTSTHGHHAAPAGPLDFILSAFGAVIVLLVIIYTIKFFVRPRERSQDHIKRRILRDEVEEAW